MPDSVIIGRLFVYGSVLFIRRDLVAESILNGVLNWKGALLSICSISGYASEVWAPQSCIRYLKLVEGVQRRPTRYISGCHRDPNSRAIYNLA